MEHRLRLHRRRILAPMIERPVQRVVSYSSQSKMDRLMVGAERYLIVLLGLCEGEHEETDSDEKRAAEKESIARWTTSTQSGS